MKTTFPTLEADLYHEIINHGTVKAGETLLKVGQTIRSTMQTRWLNKIVQGR